MDKIMENTTIDDNGCWNWNKSVSSSGYGQFTKNKKYWNTHRYVYLTVKGSIPDGMVVRHLCHNRRCCNPDHLEVGTEVDNWKDSEVVHRVAASKRRSTWLIDGKLYKNIREANKETGISQSSLVKHSINGVFNLKTYREACKTANCEPKI